LLLGLWDSVGIQAIGDVYTGMTKNARDVRGWLPNRVAATQPNSCASPVGIGSSLEVSHLIVRRAIDNGIIQGEQVHAGLLCLCLTCSWGPMQRVVPYLLIAARVLAILAVLAGLAGGS